MNNECYYPDWEGGIITGEHRFHRDGYCVFCGEKKQIILDKDLMHDINNAHFINIRIRVNGTWKEYEADFLRDILNKYKG